jgi:hypothetical protein
MAAAPAANVVFLRKSRRLCCVVFMAFSENCPQNPLASLMLVNGSTAAILPYSGMIKHFSAALLALTLSVAAAESVLLIPPPNKILSTLRPDRPRLFATPHQFKGIAEKPALAEWHKKLQERGDKLLGQAPAKYEIPDGLRLLSVSREVVSRMQTLGLLYHTTGRKAYAERAWKELEAVAAFKDWNPRHFLDTAEMAHAFAIGYDWLYDFLSEDQRKVIREALVEKALRPAESVYKGTGKFPSFHKAKHNWNQVCNGGIAMGALAIADEEPELAGYILNRAAETIQLAMREYGPDGAWAEGPGYWNYATTYNVAFLAALETALGTDFGLSQIEGFDRSGDFPIHLTGPLGRTFNYADGGDSTIRSPAMYWLARKFNRPDYASHQSRVASGQPMDLVWHMAADENAAPPLAAYFRAAEVVTMRSGWNDQNALFVGFKAGDNKANHSNLDLGTFVLDALGVRWALDLGADNYNLPGYFGKKRWEYYRMRAEGHNVVVVNPAPGPDQLPSAAARIGKFQAAPERMMATADLSPAYASSGATVKRGIALLSGKQVLVQDEVAVPDGGRAWWFMHTAARVEIAADGASAMLEQNGKRLEASILSPAGAVFEVRKAEPLPESPQPEKQNPNDAIRKLAINLPEAKNVRVAVLLRPVEGEDLPAKPAIAPLAEW